MVLIENRTERNEWSKAFQVPVLHKGIQVPLGRTYGFPFRWKGKDMHSSLKTEYASVLVGRAHMNPSGTPAVTRLQTFTNWCFLSITMVCTLNWFCASHSSSFGSYHTIFEEPGKCQLQIGLGNRFCQQNKLAQESSKYPLLVCEKFSYKLWVQAVMITASKGFLLSSTGNWKLLSCPESLYRMF